MRRYKTQTTDAKIKADFKKDIAAKMGKNVEWIYCKGMKVKIVGHTYTLFPTDNKAENALRKFIEGRL